MLYVPPNPTFVVEKKCNSLEQGMHKVNKFCLSLQHRMCITIQNIYVSYFQVLLMSLFKHCCATH
jgi:hypothetical protein